MQYTPDVLIKFADKLYAQAERTIILWALFGAALGIGPGFVVATQIDRQGGPIGGIAGALLVALILGVIASDRALK